MIKYAVIDNNTIINIISADESFIVENGINAIPIRGSANIGDKIVRNRLIRKVQPLNNNLITAPNVLIPMTENEIEELLNEIGD
jgi:hypothetical protein